MKRKTKPVRTARRARSARPRKKALQPEVLPRQGLAALQIEELDSLRTQLELTANAAKMPHWNADPDDVQRSVVKLVLTLVEFIRKLLERQAIRRMENGTLTPREIESVGQALMRLEETVLDLAKRFDIPPDQLNLELGPLGRLM